MHAAGSGGEGTDVVGAKSSAEQSSGAPRLPAPSSTKSGCPQPSALRSAIDDLLPRGRSRHLATRRGRLAPQRCTPLLSLATSPYTIASHQRGHVPYTTTSTTRSTAASQSRSRHLHRGADQKRGAKIRDRRRDQHARRVIAWAIRGRGSHSATRNDTRARRVFVISGCVSGTAVMLQHLYLRCDEAPNPNLNPNSETASVLRALCRHA